ncbi:MAG: TerB family tellurite resistance protein [Gammaproteobacteria bacterium]|nr:TerB family tellurite resistance protein [Gammaproteobacteria bacterium]
MFKSLKELFQKKVVEQESTLSEEQELQLAAAVLMFELIRCDGSTDKVELNYMAEILRNQFNLSDADLDELFKLAKKSAEDATDLHRFTRAICDKWGNSRRMKLLENLWMISLADEEIDAHERHLVRKVAGLMYLTESQIVQSRENAKRRLNIDDFA